MYRVGPIVSPSLLYKTTPGRAPPLTIAKSPRLTSNSSSWRVESPPTRLHTSMMVHSVSIDRTTAKSLASRMIGAHSNLLKSRRPPRPEVKNLLTCGQLGSFIALSTVPIMSAVFRAVFASKGPTVGGPRPMNRTHFPSSSRTVVFDKMMSVRFFLQRHTTRCVQTHTTRDIQTERTVRQCVVS